MTTKKQATVSKEESIYGTPATTGSIYGVASDSTFGVSSSILSEDEMFGFPDADDQEEEDSPYLQPS